MSHYLLISTYVPSFLHNQLINQLITDWREHARLGEAWPDDWRGQGRVGGHSAELGWEPQVRPRLRPRKVEDGRQEGAASVVQGADYGQVRHRGPGLWQELARRQCLPRHCEQHQARLVSHIFTLKFCQREIFNGPKYLTTIQLLGFKVVTEIYTGNCIYIRNIKIESSICRLHILWLSSFCHTVVI